MPNPDHAAARAIFFSFFVRLLLVPSSCHTYTYMHISTFIYHIYRLPNELGESRVRILQQDVRVFTCFFLFFLVVSIYIYIYR